jgi:hypothetical protein
MVGVRAGAAEMILRMLLGRALWKQACGVGMLLLHGQSQHQVIGTMFGFLSIYCGG